jgi:hypothetical protein
MREIIYKIIKFFFDLVTIGLLAFFIVYLIGRFDLVNLRNFYLYAASFCAYKFSAYLYIKYGNTTRHF